MGRLGFFVGLAWAAMRRSLGITVLTVGTISTALAILAVFGITLFELQRLSERVGSQLAVSAYLSAELDRPDAPQIEALLARVSRWTEVETAEHISSAEAMRDFREQLGDEAVILDGLDPTVLPPSIEVALRPSHRRPAGARAVADRLRRSGGVEEVRYGERRLRRLEVVHRFAQTASAILGAALLLATVAIVANTVRLTVFSRKEEIEVMALVGASGVFVRVPFLLEGAIQGAMGGLLALLWLRLLEGVFRSGFGRLLEPTFGPVQVQVQWAQVVAAVVVAGAVLGLLGAAFAVTRFLRAL
ncbi:MAG TPA: permease-like cell division protein FtsX [Myxococcales bacterium LLY-WYZ-16_1]|nr:permease-like cell division protein FtsX [Myxococcales bacterium LLY-WYZ-16_1]